MEKRNEKKITPEQHTALFCSVWAVICTIVAFVSPYWLVSWSRIHTPMDRLGLWEFCLDGLIYRLDPTMKSYFGCWWIFAPEYRDIQDYLQPPWFRTIQAFMVIVLILHLICFILHMCYHCRCINHPSRRVLICKLLCYVQLLCGALLFIVSVIFGAKYNDRYWMPLPELNWPSWSYGCAILSGFFSFFTSAALYMQIQRDKNTLNAETELFPALSKSTDKLTGSTNTMI